MKESISVKKVKNLKFENNFKIIVHDFLSSSLKSQQNYIKTKEVGHIQIDYS